MRFFDSFARRARMGSTSSLGAMPAICLVPSAGRSRAAKISAVWRARSFSLCSMRSSGSRSAARKSAVLSTARRPSSVRPRCGSSASVLAAPCWTRYRRIGPVSALLPYVAQFLINLIYIKLFGVERATNPFREFFVLRVFGVFHGFQKVPEHPEHEEFSEWIGGEFD